MTRAFTLIELLVVVTIIVVLLALTAPALDRAIYAAELAVCGTRLHAIATGVIGYAMEQKRSYPYRPGQYTHSWKPSNIYLGSFADRPESPSRGPDDRPSIRKALDLNGMLNDPLVEEVDFEGAQPNSGVEASYHLWFGFRYEAGGPQQGMFKVGNRFTWNGSRFDLLASDWDAIDQQTPAVYGGHPDADGVMSLVTFHDRQESPVLQLVLSRWQSSNITFRRGPIDENFVHEDGAVSRRMGVKVTPDNRVVDAGGEEMVAVPAWDDDMGPQLDIFIPATR